MKVEDEVSTYLPLPTQPVGSIEVQIENGLCLEVRDILVDWLDPDKNAKYRRATLQRDAACEFRIDGLEPGRYEVTAAASPERSGGFRQMLATEVGEQAVVRLAFEAPIVRVFGRVSVAKEPPPSNTGIAFDPVAAVGEGQAIVVPVQADGSFEVRLPGPGEYLTRIHTTPIPLVGVGRSFVAKEGYNWFEWLIEGGSLTLDIENWDRSSRIEFQLKQLLTRQPQLGRSVASYSVLESREELPITMTGLAFMEYAIEAKQRTANGQYKRAGPTKFRLTPADPAAKVTLDLQSYESFLALKGPDGSPILGASVALVVGGRAMETEPGVYRLTAKFANPGVPVMVRAQGFVPVCRLAPANGMTTAVQLATGRPAVVEFRGRDGLAFPPGELRWGDTECFVNLRDFDFRTAKSGPEMVTFAISNWPISDSLSYRLAQWYPTVPLTPKADDTFLVTFPGK